MSCAQHPPRQHAPNPRGCDSSVPSCHKARGGCDNPSCSQGTGTRQHPRSRPRAGNTQVIVTMSMLHLRELFVSALLAFRKLQIENYFFNYKKKSSSSQAPANLLYQFAIQTRFTRDKPCYPGLGKERNSSCPYSIPLPSAPLCKVQVDRRGEGGLHISQKKRFFLPKCKVLRPCLSSPSLSRPCMAQMGSHAGLNPITQGISELRSRAIHAGCI